MVKVIILVGWPHAFFSGQLCIGMGEVLMVGTWHKEFSSATIVSNRMFYVVINCMQKPVKMY